MSRVPFQWMEIVGLSRWERKIVDVGMSRYFSGSGRHDFELVEWSGERRVNYTYNFYFRT
jgi:hypothetical protein